MVMNIMTELENWMCCSLWALLNTYFSPWSLPKLSEAQTFFLPENANMVLNFLKSECHILVWKAFKVCESITRAVSVTFSWVKLHIRCIQLLELAYKARPTHVHRWPTIWLAYPPLIRGYVPASWSPIRSGDRWYMRVRLCHFLKIHENCGTFLEFLFPQESPSISVTSNTCDIFFSL